MPPPLQQFKPCPHADPRMWRGNLGKADELSGDHLRTSIAEMKKAMSA